MTRALVPSNHFILEWRAPGAGTRQLITEDKEQALLQAAVLRHQGVDEADIILVWRVFTHQDLIVAQY